MEGLLDFFSREAGQRRRRALEDAISYYVPPELRGLLGLAEEMSPIRGAERAGQGAQRVADPSVQGWDKVAAIGDTLSETAGVVAPTLVASRGAMPMANAIEETLLGWSQPAMDAGDLFMLDESGALRLRTPGAFTVRGDEFFDAPHGIARKKDPALYTPYGKVKHTVAPSDYEVRGQILPTLTDPQIIDPSALEGKTLYFPTGDRTSNQRLIESINGVDLPQGVLTHGGPEYKDFQGSWASERGALTARRNALKEAVENKEDPILAYMPMGERSGDFSRHVGETYGALVDVAAAEGRIQPGADDLIPEKLRKGFPGFTSGRFAEWLAAQKGGNRAAIIKKLDSADAQSFGLPEVAPARFATTNPDLVTSDALSVGYRFSVPDLERGLLVSDEHPSYNAKFDRAPGTVSQSLGFEVPWWIGARDTAAGKVTDKGYALPKDIKSYMGNPSLSQMVDPQWVHEVSTYGELLRTDGEEAAQRYARGLLDAILANR